jgi:outer membrane protein assembly factor BamB
MRFSRLWPILATSVFLTGCGSASKLLEGVTGEKDVVLPGKRESVLSPSESSATQSETSSEPIVIPTAETNSSWAPARRPGHQFLRQSLGRRHAVARLGRQRR